MDCSPSRSAACWPLIPLLLTIVIYGYLGGLSPAERVVNFFIKSLAFP